jgi:Fe-S cluster assembly scaffold protein SufB
MNKIDQDLLAAIADLHATPVGAYNIRKNSESAGRASSENIIITPKADKSGIDIFVKPNTKHESVHIPVIITETGLTELVYNDFEIGENADVVIVAGCGIHNGGDATSQHDGVHRFKLHKNARVSYVEKHYGEGDGKGKRVFNPTTILDLEEGAYCELKTIQIRGVDSTKRETTATLESNAHIVITERLLTHGSQTAESNMTVYLKGAHSSAQVVSRSVAQDSSSQVFNPRVIGQSNCRAHVQCDSIIMGSAQIRSIPEIAADHPDAQLVHEAAIGKIAGDQILKLMTLGLTEAEAEERILQAFLK